MVCFCNGKLHDGTTRIERYAPACDRDLVPAYIVYNDWNLHDLEGKDLMKDKTTIVFHGFLQLAALEKLELVNAINEYFDSTDREPIRAAADAEFEELRTGSESFSCPCCER